MIAWVMIHLHGKSKVQPLSRHKHRINPFNYLIQSYN